MTSSDEWHRVEIDESVFSLDVVTKATYWLTARFDVDVRREQPNGQLFVAIAGRGGPLATHEAREVEQRLRRDLIDFRTRALVERETRTIREILVAKAFDDGADD